jgi:uncharacterized OB-fold protein
LNAADAGDAVKPFRVQPALDDENRFFWTSGEDGRLRFLRCQTCGYYLHPPLPRGTEPYAIALVTIPEQDGLRLTTNIVGCPLEDIHIGLPVQVTFEQHDLVFFPLFEPLRGSGGS